MITNPILEEKARVQRELAAESGNNVGKYIENVHQIVAEAEKQYGVEFKYLDTKQGT